MKKIYLFTLLMLTTITLGAHNKRLAKVSLQESYSSQTATLSYDDQDRVMQVIIEKDGKTNTATVTYEGTDVVKISYQYSRGTDTFAYTLSDGRIQTEEIFLDVDYVNYLHNYKYDGTYLTGIDITQTVNGRTKYMGYEFTWSEGSITEAKFNYQGECETHSTCTLSDVNAHPLISLLFGINDGYPKDLSDDILPFLCMYQYMGTLPEKPWSQVNIHDYSDNKDYVYTYDYILDSEGDVFQVNANKQGSSSERTYLFEWETASTAAITPLTSYSDMSNSSWYTLEGQKLVEQPTQKGIFITNGRKVVMK